ncbi:MAG: sodium/proton-translocating pyrophosphatase, partial [Janthinobacterium lividum]
GLESAVYTTLVIAGALYLAFLLAGGVLVLATFLVALVGCGVLCTVGVIVAMDTVVRVSDNTRGIAEMEGDVDEEGGAVRTGQGVVADPVKATTRALATATAVIAATAVFVSFRDTVITELSDFAGTLSKPPSSYLQTTIGDAGVSTPTTLIGVLLGAAVVFLCAGLTMDAVGQARRDIVRELPTGLLALFAPVAVGFGLGVAPLAGFLGGAIATGVLLAVSCSNSGATTLRGDTVEPDRLRGDAVMDSAVSAVNSLLKVMSLVALLVAPAIVSLSLGTDASPWLRYGIAVAALVITVVAVAVGRNRRADVVTEGMGQTPIT